MEDDMEERFDLFMGTVDECFRDLVSQIHDYLTGQGCDCEIKTAKSGHVVSYIRGKPKRRKRIWCEVYRRTSENNWKLT